MFFSIIHNLTAWEFTVGTLRDHLEHTACQDTLWNCHSINYSLCCVLHKAKLLWDKTGENQRSTCDPPSSEACCICGSSVCVLSCRWVSTRSPCAATERRRPSLRSWCSWRATPWTTATLSQVDTPERSHWHHHTGHAVTAYRKYTLLEERIIELQMLNDPFLKSVVQHPEHLWKCEIYDKSEECGLGKTYSFDL